MKTSKKKNITIDDLAGMVARGFSNMDEKFAEIDKKFEHVEERFEEIDKKFEHVEERFVAIDGRFDGVDERLDSLDVRLGYVEKGVLGLKEKTNESDNKFVRQREFDTLSLRVNRLEKSYKK